jgi:hypothetical protein
MRSVITSDPRLKAKVPPDVPLVAEPGVVVNLTHEEPPPSHLTFAAAPADAATRAVRRRDTTTVDNLTDGVREVSVRKVTDPCDLDPLEPALERFAAMRQSAYAGYRPTSPRPTCRPTSAPSWTPWSPSPIPCT